MRVSRDEKDRSYERIVEAASALLRESGVDATSIASVMNAAGMTHGGFYRHFDSKDALLLAALDAAFDEIAASLESDKLDSDRRTLVLAFRDRYLSKDHVDNPAIGCPVAALVGDVRHASPTLRNAFGEGIDRIVSAIEPGVAGKGQTRREHALRMFAMMVGAVVIARACDEGIARQMLEACRK